MWRVSVLLAVIGSLPPSAYSLHAEDQPRSTQLTQAKAPEGELRRRAIFGAQLAPVTKEVRERQKLDRDGGVLLEKIFPGTSAAEADFKAGDVILAIGEAKLTGVPMFLERVGKARGGDVVTFAMVRDGVRDERRATLKEMPREKGEGYDVIYSFVTSHGARLRTIITRPKGEGRHPAVMLLQGGHTCFPIDTPVGQPGSFTWMVRDLTRHGYVTLRVERPGCGDSEGGPLRNVDFDTELDGYQHALRALKQLDFVDADNVFLFGHSMGGNMAPLMAVEVPVRGIVVYGTGAGTWFEAVFGQRRRLASLDGTNPAWVDREMLGQARFWYPLLVEKKTPREILEQNPELRKLGWVTDDKYVGDRVYTFHHQIADKNLAEAWAKVAATRLPAGGKDPSSKTSANPLQPRVLAIWGTSDWLVDKASNAWIAEVVNRVKPGNGTFVALDSIDHFFFRAASPEESYRYFKPAKGTPPGEFNPIILETLRAWLDETAGKAKKGPDSDRAAEVDRLFAKWNGLDTPGCAIGIVRCGELVYAKGFGSADLEAGVPNTSHTVFEIASASKSFTCACIALLMDQGKLQPDDELAKFVPEIHKFDPPVRVRHLVQCHTGLWEPFHIMPLLGWDNLPVHSPYSEADVLTVLSGQKRLPFEPGTQFHYGSGDYFLLGLIVKRVTGKSLAEFARENLFQPLGMTRTFYQVDPTRVVKGRAVGYYRHEGIWHQWRVNAYLPGGGGVKTCIDDLVRWDRNFDDTRLPKGKYMDEFIREGTLLGNRYVLDADAYRTKVQQNVPNPPMGQYRGLKRIQFTGGVWGMTAAVSRFPEQRLTVICLSNNDEISPFAKTKQIANAYLANVLEPLPAATNTDEPRNFIKLPRGDLENKVGAYRLLSEGRIWNLAIKDGDLHVIDPLNKAWRLKPLAATRFRPVGDTPFYESARFLFKPGAPDRAFTMTLESHQNGFHEVLEFRRVDLADLSPTKLLDFAGAYVNDELSATYRFSVKDGALWLRVGSRHWERLDSTVSDEFIPHIRTQHDNRIISFRRDGNQRVVGFSLTFWRVKGLDFKRR